MKVWARLRNDVTNASGHGRAGEIVYWPEATIWALLPDAAELVDGPEPTIEPVRAPEPVVTVVESEEEA